MPRVLRLLTLLAMFALATACRDDVRPDLPDAGHVVRPEVVIVERKVYVSVPPALTEELPVAEGPISQCFDVAAERKKTIDVANSRFLQIGAIEGTEVEP